MATPRGTKRPRDGAFENPDLTRLREVHQRWPPQVVNEISIRLRDGLLKWPLTRFLRGVPWEEPSLDWQVDRYLGGGGFGSAALWLKKDKEGKLLDEIVMKEERELAWYSKEISVYGVTRSHEAVVQNDLNAVGCESEYINHIHRAICIYPSSRRPWQPELTVLQTSCTSVRSRLIRSQP